MAEWAFLGSLLDAVQLQSPLLGRLWLVVMLVFRILVLATVGGAVFEDEQEEFVCNTLQPGCRQTCYDGAFPVSHYRFWLFHILLLSAPPVLFAVYSRHRAGKRAGAEEAGGARRCYLLSVALRLGAEAASLAGQWLLYGFRVRPRFACARAPCPHTVDCFVSRPTEKTVFLLFYFAVGALSALLSLAELGHLLCKRRARAGDRGPEEARRPLPPPPGAAPRPGPRPAPRPGPDAPPAYAHCAPGDGDGDAGSGRTEAPPAAARRDLAV